MNVAFDFRPPPLPPKNKTLIHSWIYLLVFLSKSRIVVSYHKANVVLYTFLVCINVDDLLSDAYIHYNKLKRVLSESQVRGAFT